MELTYQPIIDKMAGAKWGACDNDYVEEFKNSTNKFANECNDAIK